MRNVFADEASEDEGDRRLRSFAELLTCDLNVSYNLSKKVETRYAIERLDSRCRKKFRVSNNSLNLHNKAVADFIAINELVSTVRPNLDPNLVSDARLFIRVALERFTVHNGGCGVLDLGMCMRMWRHGPGKSHGVRGTHFVSKTIEQSNTVTERSLRFAQILRKLDPHLAGSDALQNCEFKIIRGSRLTTVPKNEDTRRTIASEPLWNMSLQLAAGMYIEGALRTVGLDLSTQPDINKYLAWTGSFMRDLATLDLKSASDLMTLDLIKMLWPIEWFSFLSAIRSEEIKVPGHGWVRLNMLSTMGNGFTFPVMTLTLLAIVYACQSHRIEKSMFWDKLNTGVFGDDIVVPNVDVEFVKEALVGCGLIVNNDKSYTTGLFKESCGGDFYNGKNVTPFYVKSLRSDPEIYIAINQLLVWSIRHRVVLVNTFRFLVGLLSVNRPFLVPMWEAPYAGIRTSLVGRRYYKWVVKKKSRHLNLERINSFLAMQLIVGQFVTSTEGSCVCFTSRTNRTTYKQELARLPRGYLDGSDPRLRGTEMNHWVAENYSLQAYTREG